MSSLHTGNQAQELEEGFIIALFRFLQTIRIHHDNNRLVIQSIQDFRNSVEKLVGDDDSLLFYVTQGRLYVQGERIRIRKGIVQIILEILEFLKQRGIPGLVFRPAFKDASDEELLSFARHLIASVEQSPPSAWLSEHIEKVPFSWVEVPQIDEDQLYKRDRDLREKARVGYLQTRNSVKELVQKLSLHGRAGIRKALRMVQNMVDLALQDESIFLGLSTIKDYDDYTYTHSVNVAVLSMCLGRRIGLSRISLEYLGICGLLHDLGKVEVPRRILNKPDKLTDTEWKAMQKHPLSSVRQILKLRASHALKSRIILAPFEHHQKYNLSGYPKVHIKKSISLFGRILHIADVYDAVTSPRIYRPAMFSPDQAIKLILSGAGKEFDPLLAKVFAVMMGTYPVGTLLHLDTGEMGLVIDYPEMDDRVFPRVLLIERDPKGEIKRGETIDLEERDPESGSYLRNISKTAHPSVYGIQPADFLLAS